MKYMTFNSSCSFAGIANMLEYYKIDVSDRDIALGMGLPFLFSKEENTYLAGPMLQSSQWFNLYLNPIGFELKETEVKREDVPYHLSKTERAMLGVRVSPQSKHAVIYIGNDGGHFQFINNKWEHTDEPVQLCLDKDELLSRLDEISAIAELRTVSAHSVDIIPHFRRSCRVLSDLKRDVLDFCSVIREPNEIRSAMNTLFRAVLLDGITMLELCGEESIANSLRTVQSQLMAAVKAGEPAILCQKLSMDILLSSVDSYIQLIENKIHQ